jgi:glycosyltransferase involved in cell wall biosynthesis
MSTLPTKHAPGRAAVCTIVSRNYLPYARVLARSVAERHPELPCFVLLVDEIDGHFDPAAEPFTVVTLDELGVPNLVGMCFRYTVLELNTALKPSFLAHLFARHGFEKVVYFDPDILVLGDLDRLLARLDEAAIVLTPHLTAPLPDDGLTPSEINILQAGTYNLGFIALRAGQSTRAMLRWWEARLADRCQMAIERGMHVDQKWIDLVPGFFDDVSIVRDPSWNAAYWNVPHRPVVRDGDRYLVDGVPCTFFHFSGFDPEKPDTVSKHQNRVAMRDLGGAADLYARYRELLLAAGFATARHWPYAFATFDNGVRIPAAARRLYLQLGDRARRFGNPFETGRPQSFFAWLNQPIDRRADIVVTRLWHAIHGTTPAMQAAFPDLLGADRLSFANWTVHHGGAQHGVDAQLIPELTDAEGQPASSGVQMRRRIYRRVVEPALPVLKPLVRGTVARNPRVWQQIVHTRMKLTGDPRLRAARVVPPRTAPRPVLGVNVAGYAQSEKGVGEAMRSELRNLEAAGIPYVVNNFVDHFSDNRDTSVAHVQENPYPVNLVHVNADQVEHFAATNGVGYFQERYNIGHWVWELSRFPDAFQRSFDFFDEVWVPTAFAQDAVARKSPIPIVRIPYSLSPRPATTLTRDHFGWRPSRFVFLFIFDFSSYLDRKNPLGLLRAFREAFAASDDVLLVLKCVHAERYPEGWQQVSEAAASNPNVTIMREILPREEIDALVQLCDCYVSLHRSEGFGLTMGEAMSHGKPVIATGYSGNMDFMTAANSLTVRHRLIELDRDHGPYERGSEWADPDEEHAAELMRWVYEHRDRAAAIGARAREDIRVQLAPATVGAQVRARLRHIATRLGIG